MDRKKVTVVTVCYNCQDSIGKTIESVLQQSYEEIEYIIIDGKSKDRTLEIAESYEKSFRDKGYELRIISEPDHGIYDAMNKGIALATGEIVGLINSGDWYETDAVKCMMNFYAKYKFDMFYASLRIWRYDTTMIKRARMRKYVTTRDWNHPTTFITKKEYQKFHYACRGIYDDWDLVLKIRKSGAKIVVCDEILANFCFGGISNKKNIKAAFGRFKERYRIYRENGYGRLYIIECAAMEIVKYLAA